MNLPEMHKFTLRETLVSCIRKVLLLSITLCYRVKKLVLFYIKYYISKVSVACGQKLFLVIMYGKLFKALILLYGQIKNVIDDVRHKELAINIRYKNI